MNQSDSISQESDRRVDRPEPAKRRRVRVAKPGWQQGSDGRRQSIPRSQAQLVVDFWKRVKIGNPIDCWEWQAGRTPYGYGLLTCNKQRWGTHRFAYSVTNGPIPIGMIVLHTCDNPPCCNPAHLRLGTHRDNTRDAFVKGRLKPGVRLLTPEIAARIRQARVEGFTYAKIADRFGVSPSNAQSICRLRSWNPDGPKPSTRFGEFNGMSKLTADKVRQIRHMASDGTPIGVIAIQFGVKHCTISRIARRATWAHIT